jgi:hypothetical protein
MLTSPRNHKVASRANREAGRPQSPPASHRAQSRVTIATLFMVVAYSHPRERPSMIVVAYHPREQHVPA